MIRRILLPILLAAVGLFISLGYSALSPSAEVVNAQTNRPAQTRNAQLSDIDRQFMIEAGQAGLGNIMLGQLALQRSNNPQVKQFANAEIQEQTQVKNNLTRIGQQVGVNPPRNPAPKFQAAMKQLSQLRGEQFDQAYIDEGGVNAHLENAALFQREAAFGQNPDLVALARGGLPTIRNHFTTASSLANYQFAQVPRTYNNQPNTSDASSVPGTTTAPSVSQ